MLLQNGRNLPYGHKSGKNRQSHFVWPANFLFRDSMDMRIICLFLYLLIWHKQSTVTVHSIIAAVWRTRVYEVCPRPWSIFLPPCPRSQFYIDLQWIGFSSCFDARLSYTWTIKVTDIMARWLLPSGLFCGRINAENYQRYYLVTQINCYIRWWES